MSAATRAIIVIDSVTRLEADAAVVAGSHGGIDAADSVAHRRVHGAAFHDASVGKGRAVVAGLDYLHAAASPPRRSEVER